ncbi:hypothetical protein [Leptolyngbya iicbica]|uniref:Uncharacterized protein n=2 Tax=Cyanophyceae TaxID=3028117 RepID=A0A4Q7ECS4_9CYAN|nr:hypothetical protein [Leptolyngbya sp. LK]RZM79035.1 hypothetical protein DYY88_09700 [Leptolyngbya sp. LK]
MNQDIFTSLLKQFTRFIDRLTDEDISALKSGKKILSFKLIEDQKASRENKDLSEFRKLADQLMEINSRVEAENLLDNLKKKNLIELSKFLDIPVQSRENISKIKEKIIESTVGYRLRSQAIQRSTD